MYHVRISASSKDYTLGNRLIEDGHNPGLMVTDKGADNKIGISLFYDCFSIRFFLTRAMEVFHWRTTMRGLRIVQEHCANYVEVYKDVNDRKVVLDDWRLPTEAELKIIMKFQGGPGEEAAY